MEKDSQAHDRVWDAERGKKEVTRMSTCNTRMPRGGVPEWLSQVPSEGRRGFPWAEHFSARNAKDLDKRLALFPGHTGHLPHFRRGQGIGLAKSVPQEPLTPHGSPQDHLESVDN